MFKKIPNVDTVTSDFPRIFTKCIV